nr:unnamed protein product [Callosobruchus analis]
MGLKNLKSTGHDDIPVTLLKETAHIIAVPLAYIINLSVSIGDFPDKLKIAHIKPVHRKDLLKDFKNYRQVSLLSNISKIFERIIYDQLVLFLESNGLFCEQQSGFRKGRNSIRAIYLALVEVLDSLNREQLTTALCIDLTKAFDMVDHGILCKKLKLYSLDKVSISLLESYLKNRQQSVVEYGNNGALINLKN